MGEFFKTNFGKKLDATSTKTSGRYHGQCSGTLISGKNSLGLKKGDQYYLDGLHKDHIEVFDKNGNFKTVMNLDGTPNVSKIEQASAQGRKIKND